MAPAKSCDLKKQEKNYSNFGRDSVGKWDRSSSLVAHWTLETLTGSRKVPPRSSGLDYQPSRTILYARDDTFDREISNTNVRFNIFNFSVRKYKEIFRLIRTVVL